MLAKSCNGYFFYFTYNFYPSVKSLDSVGSLACFELIFVSPFENCKVILQHGRIITLIDSKNITEKTSHLFKKTRPEFLIINCQFPFIDGVWSI